MCSGGAPLVCCFGGFALCVLTAWSPSCLSCEESVRALLSSGSCWSCVWTFDHLRSLSCLVVDFSFLFHMVTVCVVNALIKGELEDQERPRTRVVAP